MSELRTSASGSVAILIKLEHVKISNASECTHSQTSSICIPRIPCLTEVRTFCKLHFSSKTWRVQLILLFTSSLCPFRSNQIRKSNQAVTQSISRASWMLQSKQHSLSPATFPPSSCCTLDRVCNKLVFFSCFLPTGDHGIFHCLSHPPQFGLPQGSLSPFALHTLPHNYRMTFSIYTIANSVCWNLITWSQSVHAKQLHVSSVNFDNQINDELSTLPLRIGRWDKRDKWTEITKLYVGGQKLTTLRRNRGNRK